jgi:hypothetical protein
LQGAVLRVVDVPAVWPEPHTRGHLTVGSDTEGSS